MKYLVFGTRNQVPVEPKMAANVFQAGKQWVGAELASGRMDLMYLYAHANGGMGIVNGESHEEVYGRILESPYFVFMDWEVIPLVDWSHGFDKLIETFQKIAAMT